MKKTSNISELDKLSKKFARLSSQFTKCRDLDKMALIEREIYLVVDQMAAATARL